RRRHQPRTQPAARALGIHAVCTVCSGGGQREGVRDHAGQSLCSALHDHHLRGKAGMAPAHSGCDSRRWDGTPADHPRSRKSPLRRYPAAFSCGQWTTGADQHELQRPRGADREPAIVMRASVARRPRCFRRHYRSRLRQLATDRQPGFVASQRLAARRGPLLHFLVAFGIAIESAFEVSQRDHKTGPAVPITMLEHVMLDERPDAVPECAPHRYPPAGKLAYAERGIAVHLVNYLFQVAKRKLPDGVLQPSEWKRCEKLIALVHRAVVIAQRALAEKLRLAKIRIPAGALDPATHHVIATRHEVGIVRGGRGQNREDLITNLRGAALVGVKAENPVVPAFRDGAVTQITEAVEWNLNDSRPEPKGDFGSTVGTPGIRYHDLVRPRYAGHRVRYLLGLIIGEDVSRYLL